MEEERNGNNDRIRYWIDYLEKHKEEIARMIPSLREMKMQIDNRIDNPDTYALTNLISLQITWLQEVVDSSDAMVTILDHYVQDDHKEEISHIEREKHRKLIHL